MELIFGFEPKDEVDTIEILGDLESIVDELNFRYNQNQTLYPDCAKSWIELCDEAIEKLILLKKEDPSYAFQPVGAHLLVGDAHWLEEYDDTTNQVIMINL